MNLPVLFVLFGMLVLGAIVGSFLNVCIYRIPLEKSILWPGSHCGHCFQPIRWYDNVPLISYWVLRGCCRACSATFSMRYFLIELFTGGCFAGLFYLDVLENVTGLPILNAVHQQVAGDHFRSIQLPLIPAAGWAYFGYHAVLVALLIVTSFTDIDSMEIPFSVTITGTVLGLAGGALLWPSLPAEATIQTVRGTQLLVNLQATAGVYPWPIWSSYPAWAPPHSLLAGLMTGLAGVAAGMLVLRVVRFVFGLGRGIEGLGIGDADLMMMAGAFLGWQPILLAFFVAVFPALVIGVMQLVLRGNQMLPFGPSLAMGVLITLLGWPSIGPRFAAVLFDATVVAFLALAGIVILLVASFALRILRR